MTTRYEAVLFDLLTALLDSWTLWNQVAGDEAGGQRWRGEYLRLISETGSYRPYEELVAEAARTQGIGPDRVEALVAGWDELPPWPETPEVVAAIASRTRIGVVTNCSDELGHRAAARVGVPFDVVVTAETAGAYKPHPEPYRLALREFGLDAEKVLFVAGSRYDLLGATRVGMPVWWHNRIDMPRDDFPAPLAEHRSLRPLLYDLAAV